MFGADIKLPFDATGLAPRTRKKSERSRKGTPRDYIEALKWYRKAAELEYPDADLTLGNLYANGYGLEQDYKKAEQHYRKAAEAGNALAQSNLGHLYEGGWGVAQDQTQAVSWLRKAADQGIARARSMLAVHYLEGY